jgi:hypothetical protein
LANSCPVNFKKLDENQVRIQALFITFAAVGFVLTGWAAFAFLLLYDYVASLFISAKFSIFAKVANSILNIFNIQKKLIDSAPKIFASRLGFALSLAIVLMLLFGMNEAATIFAAVLALCSGLDGLFNYCVGCKLYAVLHHFKMV